MDRKDIIADLNSKSVILPDDGLFYLRQLKELGGELDENGELKKSLDKLITGGVVGGVDGAIDSLTNLKIGDKQISKNKLDELVRAYEEASAKKNSDSEAILKEIQDILEKEPDLASENVKRLIENQTKIRDERVKRETGRDAVFEGKVQNLSKNTEKWEDDYKEGERTTEERITVDLKRDEIGGEEDAIQAIIKLKQSGEKFKGSSVEKAVIRIIGKRVPNEDIALILLRNNLAKIRAVNGRINTIAEKLTTNPRQQELIKKEIEKIVTGEELTSEEEIIKRISQAISEGEITTETEIATKEAVKTAKEVMLRDPSGVRLYRKDKYQKTEISPSSRKTERKLTEKERKLLGKELSAGGNISEREQKLLERRLLKQKERITNEVVSIAKIENQGTRVMSIFAKGGFSEEEAIMRFRRLEMAVGLAKMSENRRVEILEENERINSEFEKGVPYQNLSKKSRAFDDVAAALRDEKTRGLLRRIQGKRIQETNGFTRKIGRQHINSFVDSSMRDFFTGSNTDDVIEKIYNRMLGQRIGGLKTPKEGFLNKITSVSSSGLKNLSTTAGSFLKKSLGNLGTKLGPRIGRSFTKVGSGLGNLAMKLGGGLTPAGMALKSSAVVTIVIVIVIGLLLFRTQHRKKMVSSLLPEIEIDESLRRDSSVSPSNDGLSPEGKVVCSVMDKTVMTWQGNYGSVLLSDGSCDTLNSGKPRTIASSGCGLVSTSIILRAHDPTATPDCLVDKKSVCADKSNFFNFRCGISWTGIRGTLINYLGEGAINYGLDTDWKPKDGVYSLCDEDWIKNAICKGNVVMVLFKHYPSGGHWVTAVAVLDNGDVVLKDPGYGRGKPADQQLAYLSEYNARRTAEDRITGTEIRNCMAVRAACIRGEAPCTLPEFNATTQ